MFPSPVPRLLCGRHCAGLLLLGCLIAWGGRAGAADGADYWSVCTDAAGLARQLAPIAARIEGRVEADRQAVLISAVPQGEGSTEYFLASMADVFAQLRGVLQTRKVPLQRVGFQWLSLSEGATPDAVAPVSCRGAVILIEVAARQP